MYQIDTRSSFENSAPKFEQATELSQIERRYNLHLNMSCSINDNAKACLVCSTDKNISNCAMLDC